MPSWLLARLETKLENNTMADINKIAEELGTLTILEAADLVKLLEEKWGVSAAAPVAVAAAAAPAAEEKTEFDPLCRQYGLDLVSLIAPTSHDRIRMIAKEASGFVYCVSSLGVTGVRSSITTDIGAMVKLVKETQDIPCAVGFGISTPEQAAKMAAQSDGAIVGSAIVKICAKYGKDCVPHVKAYVKSMKDAVRSAN